MTSAFPDGPGPTEDARTQTRCYGCGERFWITKADEAASKNDPRDADHARCM
jgi:hypothetical protein